MARIKHKDMNPVFEFEYTPDIEQSVIGMLDRVSVTDRLNSSVDILPSGDKRIVFEVSNKEMADAFSNALAEFRKDFYGLNNLNIN